jgi:high-affinity iron transporter
MIAQTVIALREGLEALLLVAILITYLKKVGKEKFVPFAIYGALAAVAVGVAVALALLLLYGGLEKTQKLLFEGITAFIAVVVLTYMVYWMAVKGREMRAQVVEKAAGGKVTIMAASFIFVVREAIETVLFMIPFATRDVGSTALGIIAGIILATLVTGIFITGIKRDIRRFFYYSSILLILIAASLAGYGAHELIEYAEELEIEPGWLGKPAYDLGIEEGSLLHPNGIIGSIFAVFGYTEKAKWARLLIYLGYLSIALPIVLKVYARGDKRILTIKPN